MASKTYVTSKAPKNKMNGGLDAISSQGIYNVTTGKGRRQHKKRRKAIQQVGGDDRVQNSWSTSGNTGVTATTVVKAPTKIDFKVIISKVDVVLGDETTYTEGMIAKKYESKIDISRNNGRKRKVKAVSQGYMAKLNNKNGRRVDRSTASKINNKPTMAAFESNRITASPRKLVTNGQVHGKLWATWAHMGGYKLQSVIEYKKSRIKSNKNAGKAFNPRPYSDADMALWDKMANDAVLFIEEKHKKAAERGEF